MPSAFINQIDDSHLSFILSTHRRREQDLRSVGRELRALHLFPIEVLLEGDAILRSRWRGRLSDCGGGDRRERDRCTGDAKHAHDSSGSSWGGATHGTNVVPLYSGRPPRWVGRPSS